ncbi:MAG: 6-aminohexanoate hydrolase, partial [Dongiales bacterium]
MTQANPTAAELGIMAGSPPALDKRVSLANWDLPPFNRWSFQNVRSVLPTRAIPRNAGPGLDLPQAPHDLEEVSFTDLDGSHRTVGDMLATT